MPAKIILAGEGGQGVQVVAKIITKAASRAGKKVSYLPSFGVEQRGGVSVAFVQISSTKNISYPRFHKANIVAAFSNRSIHTIKDYLEDRSLFIYDNSAILDKNLEKVKNEVKNYLAVPAVETATKKYTSRVSNMILLGAISNQLKDIPYQEFERAILKEFETKINKNPELKDLNLNAFKEGVNFAQAFDMNKTSFSGVNEKEIVRKYNNSKTTWERFPEYCKGCSLCIIECPVHALTFSKDLNFLETPMPIVDMVKCIGCKKCMQICPDGAIKVENKTEDK